VSSPDDQPHTRTRYPAGEQPPEAATGRHPLRTLAAVLVAVAALLIAIAVINRTNGGTPSAGAGGSTAAAASASSTAPTGTQPVSTSQDGIATGFPHTSEGAQSAAVNYSVALGSSEMYATSSRHAILQTIVDPATEAATLAQSDSAYTAQGRTFGLVNGAAPEGETFVSRTIPVGSKVDTYNGSNTTVEVWCTSLGGIAGQGSTNPVTAYWFTEVLQLHWVGGDWKMSAYNQKDGPVPVSGSQTVSSASTIAGAVTQFGGFSYAR
jgi:hypothetical protein